MSEAYADLFAALAEALEACPDQKIEFWWSEVERFECSRCGMGCRRPWQVRVTRAWHQRWARPLAELTGLSLDALFVPLFEGDDKAWAHLAKQPDSGACLLLGEDNLCRIHKTWGAEAKPEVCRYYPFAGMPDEPADLGGRTLAMSCTRAARMLAEPQALRFRLLAAAPRKELEIRLCDGQYLSRPAWLMWTGHLLEGLETAPDFGRWLAGVATALKQLRELPFGRLRPADTLPLSFGPAVPMSPAERNQVLGWLEQTVIMPLLPLPEFGTWLARYQDLAEPSPVESGLIENYLVAYWRRQLLLPVHLLRGELDLFQSMLTVGIQSLLIRLLALSLRPPGHALKLEQLAEAANQIYLYVVRDHVPGTPRRWGDFSPEACLAQLAVLSRFD